MANGASAPNYRLSQGTQKRVFEAGVDPTNAKSGKTARQHLTNAAIADEVGNIATDVKDQVIEKQEDTATREEAWDTGFDAMSDRGSWASGELFDQFQDLEGGYRDEYLEAVRKGDTKGQSRMLKDQGARASGLQGWKETMETAKQINDGVGWSNAFNGDIESQQIMKALTQLDGKSAVARFGEQGEMVFDIQLPGPPPTKVTKTRREVDEMVSKGIKPVKAELAYLQGLTGFEEGGASGKPFNLNIRKRQHEIDLGAKPDEISTAMSESYGGATFADHIKKHPDMKAAVINQFGDVDGVEGISPKEKADMEKRIEEDMGSIIKEMEQNPAIAIPYVADWRARREEQSWERGRQATADNAAAVRFNNMGKDAQAVELQAKADKDMVESLGGDAALIQAYFSQSNN